MEFLNGLEPSLQWDNYTVYSGHEPMLGGERLRKLYQGYLIDELYNRKTTHNRRYNIGQWFDNQLDDRPGIALRADGLPDLVWCFVRSGKTTVRDKQGTRSSFEVDRFYIAQYPITCLQYACFLEAEDGHHDPQWWGGLQRRDEYSRAVPSISNQPIQEVSWYDAVAYCRWLTDKLGYTVRLPTEQEWQLAATGGDPDKLFPWGRYWERDYANTRESHLRKTTAVGMYPHGESPVGALDMCGTVLEWCQNHFSDPAVMEDTIRERRVVRGGSWFLVKDYGHNYFRMGYDPYQRFNSLGFRLVAETPSLDDDVNHPAIVK